MCKNTIEKINYYGKNSIPFLFIFDFEMKNPMVFKIDELPGDILFKTRKFKNYKSERKINKKINFYSTPVDFGRYMQAFKLVQAHIKNGNTFLLNLTFPSRIETNLSLEEIFYISDAKYKLMFQNKFVVFSPEIFIEIRDNKISSYPMKGTIDANLPNAERILLDDVKETAEHNTIVDLIRNDLSMVSENVRVERFRYLEKIQTNKNDLLQASSKITGDLSSDHKEHLGDMIFKLLPAGSISGAPKKRTVEIIKEAENYERGYYTGIFGYFDGNNLDSAVMIRFIENQNGRPVFKSGGGITYLSKAETEYQELINKIYVPFV